ncbi:MAG: DMT family transporter [Bacillota bacterium]|nr:DMT family transporter [Bacillota bacterium]
MVKKSYVKYLLSVLIFGSNGIIASCIALNSYEIVLCRSALGGLALVLICLLTKGKMHFRDEPRQAIFVLISGMAMGGSWMFLYEAYSQVGVGVASLLYYCGPVIVMALSPLVFREKLTVPKIVGFLAVIIGVVLINGTDREEINPWGIFCGIMGAVLYALMLITNKKATKIVGLENSMLQVTSALLVVGVYVLIKQGFSMQIERGDWLPIIVLGVVNTGLGCYFYFSSIDYLPVQTVAVCGYIEPLAAVVFGAIILHESMDALKILGAVLILGGAMFAELYKTQKTELV